MAWLNPRSGQQSYCGLYPQHRALRVGDWKIISKSNDVPWELYDLANDAGETTNLAAQHSKRLRDLVARWNQWAESCNDSQ